MVGIHNHRQSSLVHRDEGSQKTVTSENIRCIV